MTTVRMSCSNMSISKIFLNIVAHINWKVSIGYDETKSCSDYRYGINWLAPSPILHLTICWMSPFNSSKNLNNLYNFSFRYCDIFQWYSKIYLLSPWPPGSFEWSKTCVELGWDCCGTRCYLTACVVQTKHQAGLPSFFQHQRTCQCI